ncbi:MAG: hypothetical protein RQ757_04270 [Pseudomonadales bacterium]|nr:hypothetical protein [Pseudomonadales bacterium]
MQKVWFDRRQNENAVLLHHLARLALLLESSRHEDSLQKARWQEYLAEYLAARLAEPFSHCQNLLRQHEILTYLADKRRHLTLTTEQARQLEQQFQWAQEDDYRQYSMSDCHSRILAAYHFGDYSNAYARLARHTVPGRHRLIVRQLQSHNESRLLDTAGSAGNTHFLDSHQTRPIELVARLRQGNTTVVLFCDLPPAQAETIEIDLLGQPARFPRALADIALLAACPILPVIAYHDGSRHQLQTGRLIQARAVHSESREAATRRITQRLVSFFERHFIRHPEQWRYLNLLPAYYDIAASPDVQHA